MVKFLRFVFAVFVAALFMTGAGGRQSAIAQNALSVSAEGVVEPAAYARLSLQIGGTVAEIVAPEGTAVSAGDVILRLDTQELDTAVAQAQARLQAAQASLTAAQTALQQAQTAVSTAEITLKAAQANLALVQSGPLPEEVAAAEAALAAAEAAVTQAAANRDAALTIARPADIQQAQANLAQATAELRALEEQYQDILDTCFDTPDGEVCPLYGTVEETTRRQLEAARLNQAAAQAALDALEQGATPAQRQAADAAVALAIANRDAVQARLDLLLAGATPEQIRVAEVAVSQAEVGIEIAQAGVAQAEAGVAQAEAGVAAAEAGVAQAQALADKAVLRAPFAGTVAQIEVAEGELAGTAVPVATLADFSGWLVKTTDLTELDVPLVTEGAPAQITIDALPNTPLTGTVNHIAHTATLYRGDIVYEVEITIDNPPPALRWGMTAFVDIRQE